MDLLGEDNNKNTKSNGQKIVLTLLIISVILCVVIIAILMVLPKEQSNAKYTMVLNGKNILGTDIGLRQSEDGTIYIAIKLLCNNIGYKYYNGEFRIAGEDKNKGYIDNGMCIVQFFADSQEIYKTEEDSNKDYQYYKLKNKILDIDNTLYISLDDLNVGLNLVNTYIREKNQSIIQTAEYVINQTTEKFKEQGITISNNIENNRAIAYGYIVVNKEGKYGVIDLQGEEVMGAKYNSIVFCEGLGQFIVSNTNDKFGIITGNSEAKINLQYDSIEVLNYNPILYKVERLDKYGIAKEDGTILNDIQYDLIGYPENREKETDYTLIIPRLNENLPKSIVVCKDNKYGIIDFENGEEILECNLAGIYTASKDETVYYIAETEDGKKVFLEDYINSLNRITVNM